MAGSRADQRIPIDFKLKENRHESAVYYATDRWYGNLGPRTLVNSSPVRVVGNLIFMYGEVSMLAYLATVNLPHT